jgi:hypothetical protein
LGRLPGAPPEKDQGFRVVTQLCVNHYYSGRHVTVDNFFCSSNLAETLYENGTTLLGTLRKNKGEVPKEFLSKKPHLSSSFAYSGPMQLTSYMAKPSKCVLLLSTLHTSNVVDESLEQKPLSILDYNQYKYPVDALDQMIYSFSTRRKVRRWPMTIFFHILDLIGVNAYITWVKKHPSQQERSAFLKVN